MEEVVLNKTNFDKQLQKIDELSTEELMEELENETN